jgi:hypothetical protein
MGRVSLIIAVSLLVVVALLFYVSGSSDESVGERAQKWAEIAGAPPVKKENAKRMEEPEVQKEGTMKVAFPDSTLPKSMKWDIRKAENAIAYASLEEIEFTMDMREWIRRVRVLLDHIQVLRFVGSGGDIEELADEDIDSIDIKEEYRGISISSKNIVMPTSCSSAFPLIRELKGDVYEIVNELSDPPTLPELESAEEKRTELTENINELYKLMNSYCS